MLYSCQNCSTLQNCGGGRPQLCLKKNQSLQLEAARTVLGYKSLRWSKKELLRHMDWMDLDQTLAFASNKLTYKLLHWKLPELLHSRFLKSKNSVLVPTRLSGSFKMGSRPRSVGRTKIMRNQYRAKAYQFYEAIPEDIQNLSKYEHFVKWLIFFYKYGSVNAFDKLPRFETITPTPLSMSQ